MVTVDSESDERTVNNSVRHQYRVLSDEEKAAMVSVKDWGAGLIRDIRDKVPVCREADIAIDRIQEGVMWAIRGLTQ